LEQSACQLVHSIHFGKFARKFGNPWNLQKENPEGDFRAKLPFWIIIEHSAAEFPARRLSVGQ
jgi:hypothetical protein